MAKTVRQQLADLTGGKKPNLFYKGLNSDTDEHLISNDNYSDAVNVRLNAKDGDLGTIQNLKSNVEELEFKLQGWNFQPTTTANKVFWSINGDPIANLTEISFYFATTSSYVFFGTNNHYSIPITQNALGADYLSSSTGYTANTILLHCYNTMKNDSVFTSIMNVALVPSPNDENVMGLYFFAKNQTAAINPSNIFVKSLVSGGELTLNGDTNTYTKNIYGNSTKLELYTLSLISFSEYIAAICFISENLQVVCKVHIDPYSDTDYFLETVVFGDFGIQSKTSSLIVEKIEENKNFERIYWTDGINPIKTINLKASSGAYADFDSAEDFNLFAKSPLFPISIKTVTDSGSINCGSWSYCYKLLTSDGKGSVVSPITNPIPLGISSKASQYSDAVGGTIASNSGKSVTLEIANIDTVYSKIQLIGIQYLDNFGGAAFFVLKEENINTSTVTLTHNGNENTTIITGAELLIKKNTWDVAQTIAVKDNRLLAANLKNNTSEIINDLNAFRVKSFKHSGAPSSFDTAPSSGSYSTYSELNNPDLYDNTLYKELPQNTTEYRYAYAGTGNTEKLMFGASTSNYEGADVNGVYVTFKLKKITLDDTPYWHKINDPDEDDNFPFNATNDGYCEPQYYGPLSRNGEDGYFDNYKNPLYASKYVGYMRDEIYRFGIQLYDKNGNETFTYPVGDIRFPCIESDFRFIGDVPGTYTPTAGNGAVNRPRKYVLCDPLGNGYILYPEFRVKLTQAVKKQISGFSIVRAERRDSDRRVIAAGILNTCIKYADETDNGSVFKNRVGLDKCNLFTMATGNAGFSGADETEMVTIDSPDLMFGRLNYTSSTNHKVFIAAKLRCKSYQTSQKPSRTTHNNLKLGNDSLITWMIGTDDNFFYAAPIALDYNSKPADPDSKQLSCFSKYYCDDLNNNPLTVAANSSYHIKDVLYGESVGPGEVISNSLLASSQDFVNAAMIYSGNGLSQDNNNLTQVHATNGKIHRDSGEFKVMDGNNTLALSLTASSQFDMDHANVGIVDNRVGGENHYGDSKAYVKVINPITAISGQYGGNSQTNFESVRWISTGASLHGEQITSDNTEMILPVFGGDTYVNMFSLNKFHKTTYNTGTNSGYRIAQGLIFPVESSINLDLRRGVYFGKNRPQLQAQDEYLYDGSYSSSNNLKSFPAKDSNVELVTDFKNIIAISNTKIAGQTSDAFSKFDANEIFEVNANYGGINNLITFRDTLYALQENATSIVSINTRALINAKDGSAISIQSNLGTGNVIERNDYISIKNGSQNRMNLHATDLGLYWYDNNNNSICVVSLRAPNQVTELSSTNKITNLLEPLQQVKIEDSPLFSYGTNKLKGGLNISYNPSFNEIMFSFNYSDGARKYFNISYDELLGVFTSKRSYGTFINCHYKGVLYSIGGEHSVEVNATHENRVKLYSHDTTASTYNTFYGTLTDNPYVVFSNNEEVASLKVYDKVVVANNGLSDSRIFSTFVYSTNNDDEYTLDLSSEQIDRMGVGKHIVPVYKTTGRFKGNYLTVKLEQSENTNTNDFNLFSVTSHYRKNIL